LIPNFMDLIACAREILCCHNEVQQNMIGQDKKLNQDESGADMNMRINKGKSGFTILELMIVLAIIALLVALAYPTYTDYVRKAKRGEAQQLLMNWSINQEIWRSSNPEYAKDQVGELPKPTHGSYTFSLPVRSAIAFTLRATATGDQLNDKDKAGTACSPLDITHTGAKLPAGCWD
jgi:type IV pilus assembly protein PilE